MLKSCLEYAMSRNTNFLPGEAGFLLKLLQEVCIYFDFFPFCEIFLFALGHCLLQYIAHSKFYKCIAFEMSKKNGMEYNSVRTFIVCTVFGITGMELTAHIEMKNQWNL